MVKTPHNWLVEKVQQNHIPEIFAIARDYDRDLLTRTGNTKDGFLVSRYSEEVYQSFLIQADHFYVGLENDVVIGFLLGFSRDLIPELDWVGTQMKARDTRPFILVKQVAIQRSYLGSGLALLLIQYVLERSKNKPLVSVIVAVPPNPRSMKFHERLGFKKVWEATPPDGIPRDVWCREPSA